jgi:hypothetical protein
MDEFIISICNEYNENSYSLFFISWIFFYNYGLNDEYNFHLFNLYRKSPHRNSIDEILSDVSNFEIAENIKFPWNLEIDKETSWFPRIIRGRQDSERLIRKWRAYLNVWVQVCFNNSSFSIIKTNDGLGIKIHTSKPKFDTLRAFGFLERVQSDVHTHLYTPVNKIISHRITPHFVFGPLSILKNSYESNIYPLHEHSYVYNYAWKIEVFENYDIPRVFITKVVVDAIFLEHNGYESCYHAITLSNRKILRCYDIIYNVNYSPI